MVVDVVEVGAGEVVEVVAPLVVDVVDVALDELAALSSMALNSSFIESLMAFIAAIEGPITREAINAYSTREAPVWLRNL